MTTGLFRYINVIHQQREIILYIPRLSLDQLQQIWQQLSYITINRYKNDF